MSNIFSQTEVLKLPRSFQKFNWNLITSMDYAKIYPMCEIDCVPGDTIKIDAMVNIRAKPMIHPNLTPNKFTMHFMFVPYRLLDENFTTGIAGTTEKGEAVNYDFPKWTKSADKNKSKTLWDYFGLPINVKENASGYLEEDYTNVKGIEPTVYLKRAYNKIWNDMYRNENFSDEVDLDQENLLNRCWRADYFTKSLPWQQKPSDSNYFALPVNTLLGGTTNAVEFTGNVDNAKFKSTNIAVWRTGESTPLTPKKATDPNDATKVHSYGNITSEGGINYQRQSTGSAQGGDTISDFAGAYTRLYGEDIAKELTAISTAFDVADLRLATQMQKWAERNARGGTRYDELIRSHFGITPRDARLQLPEYIGGFKFPILCGENYSTVETTDNPQGERAGIGNGMGADHTKKYFVEEYGIILGLASILPQATYQQGMQRQWIKHNQLDFYHHELCCLSEREVYEGELVCSNSQTDSIASKHNKTIFGFQGIYNEYRYHPNVITGEARLGTYADWHQSRILDASDDAGTGLPKTSLNEDFVYASDQNIRKSPFADLENEDPFLAQFNFSIKAFRPMTYKAEPGLIDHF